jgi:hypothetical protein
MRRAARGLGEVRFDKPGKAEIRYFDVQAIVEKNVLRFQIAVADAERVQILQTVDDLPQEVARGILGERTVADEEIKKFAFRGILEDNVNVSRRFEIIDNFQNVWMIEETHKGYLAVDFELESRVIGKSILFDDLDRILFIRLGMHCKSNLSTCPRAKLLDESVRTKCRRHSKTNVDRGRGPSNERQLPTALRKTSKVAFSNARLWSFLKVRKSSS